MGKNNTVSILGCGWYGFALAQYLQKAGFQVKGSCTSSLKFFDLETAGIKPYRVVFDSAEQSYSPDFFQCDVLIVAIPPKRRSGEAHEYFDKILGIKNTIIAHGPKQVIFISSTSVYSDNNTSVDEDTVPVPDTESGKVILEAERLLQDQSDFKVTILRFGGLIGPGRDPGRFFAGKKEVPNGLAPVNLIHLNDCLKITYAILQKEAFAYTFNAVSSAHPSRADFYTQAAKLGGYEVPEFIRELNNWKIVKSKYLRSVLDYEQDTCFNLGNVL
ncbi:NAD-dependent epimerase/dehydratase family protein [Desertivirga xinjiangensis]|uniref:NAD-dependent epimerase/dehydratase family protein n=1 Tax=Desertivirga xinjiangensis TaxID=539206 RepID=UPI00210A4648|nr:NAD-dependent epimerase/dehydratase family protein [Pedobacter xinjiangensis]